MINKKDIEKVINLSRIELSMEEKNSIEKDLSKIIEYIDKLKEVNIDGVLPTSHPLKIENVTRDDKINLSDKKNKIIDSFSDHEGNFLKVKPIL